VPGRARTIVVACMSVLLLALAGAAPVAAAPVQAAPVPAGQDHYAAIALEPATTANGYSFGYLTKAAAKHAAKHQCRLHADVPSNCQGVVWVRNGCASVAVRGTASSGYSYAWGIGPNKRLAKQRARNELGSGARTLVWACSG
jgi:hypothetical protein